MRIETVAAVKSREGREIGKVYEVIVNPHLNAVTHLVVETGFLMGRLVVVPIEAVLRATRHSIRLKLSGKELVGMPEFAQTDYAGPPRGGPFPLGYPPGGVLWPGGYAYVPITVHQAKSVPADSLEISRRTEVLALDGKIGTVAQVMVHARSKQLIGFVVNTEEHAPRVVCVPVSMVAAAGGGRLSLSRTKAELLARA